MSEIIKLCSAYEEALHDVRRIKAAYGRHHPTSEHKNEIESAQQRVERIGRMIEASDNSTEETS